MNKDRNRCLADSEWIKCHSIEFCCLKKKTFISKFLYRQTKNAIKYACLWWNHAIYCEYIVYVTKLNENMYNGHSMISFHYSIRFKNFIMSILMCHRIFHHVFPMANVWRTHMSFFLLLFSLSIRLYSLLSINRIASSIQSFINVLFSNENIH